MQFNSSFVIALFGKLEIYLTTIFSKYTLRAYDTILESEMGAENRTFKIPVILI